MALSPTNRSGSEAFRVASFESRPSHRRAISWSTRADLGAALRDIGIECFAKGGIHRRLLVILQSLLPKFGGAPGCVLAAPANPRTLSRSSIAPG